MAYFKDAPLHSPVLLKGDGLDKAIKSICKYVEMGNRVSVAFQRAGFSRYRYYDWSRFYREEVEAGLEDTPLIRLFKAIELSEAIAEEGILSVVRDSALEGNVKTAMYLLDNRFEWKKPSDITVDAGDDRVVNITINPMTDNHLSDDDDDLDCIEQ